MLVQGDNSQLSSHMGVGLQPSNDQQKLQSYWCLVGNGGMIHNYVILYIYHYIYIIDNYERSSHSPLLNTNQFLCVPRTHPVTRSRFRYQCCFCSNRSPGSRWYSYQRGVRPGPVHGSGTSCGPGPRSQLGRKMGDIPIHGSFKKQKMMMN